MRSNSPHVLGDATLGEFSDNHPGIVLLIGRRTACVGSAALAACAVLAIASLAGCGVGNVRTDVVIVNAGEPQNPLIPTNTNDSNGGRIVDRLFAGLMSYDVKGTPDAGGRPVDRNHRRRQLPDHPQARAGRSATAHQ